MKLTNSVLFLSFLALVVVSSCSKDEDTNNNNPVPNPDKPALVVPAYYDSINYPTTTAFVQPIRTHLDAIVTEVKRGRTPGQKVSATAMKTSFAASLPSLESITIPAYAALLTKADGWLDKAEKASGNTYHPDSTSTMGGTFGGYLFDENGFEPEQMIEKGLFGAALSKSVFDLLNNPSLDQVDQAVHIIGATPHFKSSNAIKHGSAADKYLSTYVARRDKNDGNGLYSQMRFNFIKLKAAVKAGANYNKERDEAITAIRLILEQANFATVINYCHTSIANLSKTSITDAEKAATLHAIGECHGFALGWKGIAGKKITDAQIDEIMELLNAPVAGGGKPSLFITDRTPAQIGKLQQVIIKVQAIYGFTTAQIEDFKKNWVAEQSR
jgi:hypothetical protein